MVPKAWLELWGSSSINTRRSIIISFATVSMSQHQPISDRIVFPNDDDLKLYFKETRTSRSHRVNHPNVAPKLSGCITIVSTVPLHLLQLPSSYHCHNMIDHSGICEIDTTKVGFLLQSCMHYHQRGLREHLETELWEHT